MIPSPSFSHCTAAPAMKMDPSSAYCTGSPGSCHPMVVSTPSPVPAPAPLFITTKAPVPKVALAIPGAKHP